MQESRSFNLDGSNDRINRGRQLRTLTTYKLLQTWRHLSMISVDLSLQMLFGQKCYVPPVPLPFEISL